MDSVNVEQFYCPQCAARVESGDRFCRRCSAPLGTRGAVGTESLDRPVTDRRWFVLLMLFVGLGPLALPMLWNSPEFSHRSKIALTAVVVLLTAVLVAVTWIFACWVLNQLHMLGDPGGAIRDLNRR